MRRRGRRKRWELSEWAVWRRWELSEWAVWRRWDLSDRTAGTLLAILAVATLARVVGVTRWSLWLDEIYSASLRTQEPLAQLLYVPYDPHPPLYFLLMRGWTAVWGTGPVAVRSLSVLLSVATVLGMFVLGRALFDVDTGLIAAAFFALSTTQIHFGRTARMYPLFALLTVASLYYFARLPAERRGTDLLYVGSRTDLLYVGSTVALLYTHVFGVFVVLGEHLAMGARRGFVRQIEWRRWLGVSAAVGVLFLPWTLLLAEQVLALLGGGTGGGVSIGWIPEPSLGLLRNTAFMYAGSPWELYPIVSGNPATIPLARAVLAILALGVLLSLGGWKQWFGGRDGAAAGQGFRPTAIVLLVVLSTIVAVPYLTSMVLAPIYFPRFTVAAMVPLGLLVANGISRIRPRSLGILAILLLLGSSLVLTATYYEGTTQEPWEPATDVAERTMEAGDLVVVQPSWATGYFAYYYTGDAGVATAAAVGLDSGGGGAGDGSTGGDGGAAGIPEGAEVCVFQYGDAVAGPVERFQTDAWQPTASFEQGVIRTACYAPRTR